MVDCENNRINSIAEGPQVYTHASITMQMWEAGKELQGGKVYECRESDVI